MIVPFSFRALTPVLVLTVLITTLQLSAQETQPAVPNNGPIPAGINPDSFYGKEPTEGVYVRDSAGAVEKLALAQKMERLKEWSKSADLYQEVIVKYADRVVPSRLDKDKKIYQYTSITSPIQERLAKWPTDGLDVYRARFETPAQALLDSARPDDVATLNKVYGLYFVTDAGKQAGMRLMDVYLESGEFPAAAWLGDRLLTLHPGLLADASSILYRTALAYFYGGDEVKAKDRLAELKSRFANDRGTVRGKEVMLADSLAKELQASIAGSENGSADSWPMPFGDASRSRISTAEGRPGARLFGVELSKPDWGQINDVSKAALEKQYETSVADGQTLGIFPVTDRGELFFQDGRRIYGVSLESGVAIPAWAQTYPTGYYSFSGAIGSQRSHQLTVTLTDHEVLAIMGFADIQSAQITGMLPGLEPRMVCLDRQSGREKWAVSLSTLPEEAKECRALQLCGSPLVVGDSVLAIARGAKTQFEDCYVIGFDLATGKFRWATYVASASSPNFMMWGGGVPSQVDAPSHLAYANGRIYVQTNLGALAALDAYSGAVVWLDIYPTGRQNVERQQFNPFQQASQFQPPAHKPWAYNAVVVRDGVVFTLPVEGRNLLIYDAASGVEIKRIDILDIEHQVTYLSHVDTLVGVVGDSLLLAGEKGMIYLNWKNYVKDKFDPAHDNITNWPYIFPQEIRGRPFLAKGVVFVPCADRLYTVSLKSGKAVEEYPRRAPGDNAIDWEEPEGPGNVLVTSDHLVIAGAKFLNVYTDLTLAKAKLDREIANAPADPLPRLRYAQITFAANDSDVAIAKLDEAANLMGGIKALTPGANRDLLFTDALTFADKLSKSERDDDRHRTASLYDRAASAAISPAQQVDWRLARARFEESRKEFVSAVRLYQEILIDAQLRSVPRATDGPTALQAEDVAERAVASIIKDHAAAYESFQQAAAAQLEQARNAKDDPAGKLLELARAYPNSPVAGSAMLGAASAYESAGDPRHAIRVLRDLWFKFPDSPDKARVLESIARNYLALAAVPRSVESDRGPMDNMEAAAASLARILLIAPASNDRKLESVLKLRDGTTIDTGTPVSAALDIVRKFRFTQASKALPDLKIALFPVKVRGQPYPKAFLPETAARDVISEIKSLILPDPDFSRPDRVVAYGEDKTLKIFSAGEITPLVSCRNLNEEPRSLAWVDHHLLVWGGSQAVCIDPVNGEQTWKIDLRELQTLEVIHFDDNALAVAGGESPDPNVLVAPGRRQFNVRPGQRMIFARQQMRQQQLALAVAQQRAVQPKAVNTPEEIVALRPVGDHVLMTTTGGRVLSAELSTGRIAWQNRLSDRPVDRLAANEDFSVVRVSNDTSVRIACFDTATGQLRCTRSWVVQSGMVPVNLALAADGTLVYTMPDRLCLKDLYKPWPDSSDKESQTTPGTPVFQNARNPDQLLIAEGRILALADNREAADGSVKYVRVHSLETGQPVQLKYRSPDGDKPVDRILKAGKRDQTSLKVVGSHLYVIHPLGVIGYNLDRPAETWSSPEDEPNSKSIVRESFMGVNQLVLMLESPAPEDPNAAAIPVNGPPVPPGVQPPVPINPNGANPGIVAPPADGAPLQLPHDLTLQIYARYPTSDKNPAESGRLDYIQRLSDPAGITSSWQAIDSGFYYLTGDNKLHVMRGSGK